MPYELVWQPSGVVKRFFGWVTGVDLIRSLEQSEADSRFDTLRYVINDFLDIDGIRMETIGPDLIEELAAIDHAAAGINPNIQIAIVAKDNNLSTLAQGYIDSDLRSYPTQLFSTLSAAEAWLKL